MFAATAATLAPLLPIPDRVVPVRAELLSHTALRQYQLDIILEVARLMRQGVRRILIQLPTGGGKTVLASAMLGSAAALALPSQFIVHRKELIEQTSRAFSRSGIEHGFIARGWPDLPAREITLAGVQTLVNRLSGLLPPNIAVIDEAHHATASTWARVMREYPDSFIVGLSATPERLDGRGLGEHFDVMVRGPSVAWLIEHGYLSPFDYYAPGQPDLAGVHTTAGDFNRGELAAAVDKPRLIGDIVEHYLRLAAGRQGIGFAVSREHSRKIVDAFCANGVAAAHVDGDMPDRERDRIVAAFRAGDVRLMSNVDLFGEGFDVPDAVYAGLWRPTRSLALHLQHCGRVLRPKSGGGAAVICDHAGNAVDRGLGLPDEGRHWSLSGRAAKARSAAPADAMPVRQCKTCYRVSPSTADTCPGCGEEFPTQVRTLVQQAGTLTRLTAQERAARELEKRKAAAQRKAEERACKDYADYYHLAVRRGYSNPVGWAKMRASFRNNYRRS